MVNKMNLESLKNLDKKYAQAIANYLLGRIETDECLRTKIEETNKTLKGCVDYVKSEAKKQAEDGVAMVEDSQVYDWCVHYFLEDNLDFEPKAKENKEDNKEKIEEETEKVETLLGEEEVVKEKKKTKDSKPKKNVKEDFAKQLSLFDL